MKKHVFTNHCIDWEELLAKPDIRYMLKIAQKQSKTEEAKMRVDLTNYKEYGEKESCPKYFGMFVEWLCAQMLQHNGHVFNIENPVMTDSIGSANQDFGVDGIAMSVTSKKIKGRRIERGSPVYLQVKGTMDATKMFAPNDGSRLPNFGLHAMSSATMGGHSYSARYVIFTTGQGIHHTLVSMCNDMFEVINYDKIKKQLNNNYVLLNLMRVAVGLAELPMPTAKKDAEAEWIHDEDVDLEITETKVFNENE